MTDENKEMNELHKEDGKKDAVELEGLYGLGVLLAHRNNLVKRWGKSDPYVSGLCEKTEELTQVQITEGKSLP